MSSVVTLRLHFLFVDDLFDSLMMLDRENHDSSATLSSRDDPFRNIHSLPTPSFRVDLPRTVSGSLRLNAEKMAPFVNIFPQHGRKKVEPLLRVCGIAHCT